MKIRKAVLLLACAVSWGIAVWFAGRLWAAYPLVSVRSDVPVTGRQLEALRSALRQEDGASALVPAFWSQAEGSAESRWETCGITAILYCGEYDAVYPAVLLEGRFPAAQENGKCAVSTAAAWQLWGSEDVLGQELEIEGDIYRVCGLFRSSASLALCGESLSVVCSLSCGYNRFPLVEHDPRYTLIVRDILYWETARSLWTQYLKAIPGKEEKVKRAIRGILADYEKEERDIIYLESKNHCVLVHLDGIRQTPEGSPSFYATLDEAEHEFASSAFLRIHKSYLINGDHILQMSNYKVLLDTGMTLKGSRKYFSKAKLEFYRGR